MITVKKTLCPAVSNSMNGTYLESASAGTTKDFTIKYADDSSVTVTTVSDSPTEFIGSIPNSVNTDVYYNIPYLTQTSSFEDYDEAYRKLNGGNDYSATIPEQALIQQISPDLANNRYDYLKYFNSFGHKFRFTGTGGGYYDESDGTFYDVSGSSSNQATEFPIISGTEYWWVIDHLTGYKWTSQNMGFANWTDNLSSSVSWTAEYGAQDWLVPSGDESLQLKNNFNEDFAIFSGSTNRPFFIFDYQTFNTCTTDQGNSLNGLSFRTNDIGGVVASLVKTSGASKRGYFVKELSGSVSQGDIITGVELTLNGDPLISASNNTQKDFTIIQANGNPVSITTLSDSATSFSGSIPNSVSTDVYFYRPPITQISSSEANDAAWRRINGGNDYNSSIPSQALIQQVEVDYTNGRYDYLKYFNMWGHKFRFTGINGGYYDESDGNYYDVNGVLSDLTTEFPQAGGNANFWRIYDHLTGYWLYSFRQGAATFQQNSDAIGTWGSDTGIDSSSDAYEFWPVYDEWALINTTGHSKVSYGVGGTNRPIFNSDQFIFVTGNTRLDLATQYMRYNTSLYGGYKTPGTKTLTGANRSIWGLWGTGSISQP